MCLFSLQFMIYVLLYLLIFYLVYIVLFVLFHFVLLLTLQVYSIHIYVNVTQPNHNSEHILL